jgi:WAS family protein
VKGSLPISNSPPKKMSTITSPPQLKKAPPIVKNPQEEVRSDLLKAIRDGIALKKVEAKNAIEDGKGQGMSDVATILARRVAVEFSDSDDCASESEYDSDDWGETDA